MPAAKAIKRRKLARPVAKPKTIAMLTQASKPMEATVLPRAMRLGQRVAPSILLALITFALYYPVIHHPFSNYDDAEYITDNVNIHQGITLATVRWALTSTQHANWHPVTWVSHALDWQIFGAAATGPHFTNLAFHVCNVILLFLFLVTVTRSTVRSLLVAALFALHPIEVESVAWIAERKNVLCTFFFFLALISYAWYARRPKLGRYLLVAALFSLALAAKPMVVTFPFVLLLMDYWPLQRIQGWIKPSSNFGAPQIAPWKLAVEKLPLLALSAGDCLLTVFAQQRMHAIRAGVAYPLWLRVENAIFSYAVYLWKAVWPVRLAVLYPYPAGGISALRLIASILVLIAISVWVWRGRNRRPYLLAGWLWFLGTLVPVIGLVQVGEQGMADRYAYLPLIGIFMMVAWAGCELAERGGHKARWTAGIAAVVVLIALAALTWRQVGFWQSNYGLWAHTAAITENNVAAEDVAGSELLLAAMNRGIYYSSAAQVHFQRAIKMNPHDSEALMNIGSDIQIHGHPTEALEKYKLALQYADHDYLRSKILSDIGSAYEALGDFMTAREYFQKGLEIRHPGLDDSAFLGYARTFTDEKIANLLETLKAHPSAGGYLQLAQLQDEGGYTAAARSSYQRAIEMDPSLEAARNALARDAQRKP